MSTSEVGQLLFYAERAFEITRKEKQHVKSAFDLFVLLEKRGVIKPGNVNHLKQMVQSLENRGDLYDLVRNYQLEGKMSFKLLVYMYHMHGFFSVLINYLDPLHMV